MELFATDYERLAFLLETEAALELDFEALEALAGEEGQPELPLEKRPKYITNSIGSKQNLVDWIWKHTPEGVESTQDAFSGSAVVAYMYKTKGLKVLANDRLRCCFHAARAIIEKDKAPLSRSRSRPLVLTRPGLCSYIVVMKRLVFVWDPRKAESNARKHGVTFEEARSVFLDDYAMEFFDEPHSEEGDRFFFWGLVPMPVCCWYAIAAGRRKGRSALSRPARSRHRNPSIIGGHDMKKEYDLSKMKSRKNPYAKRLKKQITLRLDPEVIEYFKELSLEKGIPYQSLINLYLKDCAATRRELKMTW